MQTAKTFLLLAFITFLFVMLGGAIGGRTGMIVALLFTGIGNFISYWNADKIVLKMYRAQPITEAEQPRLYAIVKDLAQRSGMPMPKPYIMKNLQPNAFATGRNPENAAVAVTTGLLEQLSEREIAGVIAHELAHIKNRDTLTMTVTATVAGAIGALANFGLLFGGNRERGGMIGALALAFIAPLAAGLVQMAISRTREYEADRVGGEICGDPLGLASALAAISNAGQRITNVEAERNPATAHMFISNPLHLGGRDKLFSTHPATQNRIAALEELASSMGNQVYHVGESASRRRASPIPNVG